METCPPSAPPSTPPSTPTDSVRGDPMYVHNGKGVHFYVAVDQLTPLL